MFKDSDSFRQIVNYTSETMKKVDPSKPETTITTVDSAIQMRKYVFYSDIL